MQLGAWMRTITNLASHYFSINGKQGTPYYPDKILPLAIRGALNAQRGRLFPKDLFVLGDAEYGYAVVLVYLIAKMLHGKGELQREFLAEVSYCAVRGPETRGLVRAWIKRLDPGWGVDAAKLIQLNRQGFEMWDDLYRDAFTQCAQRQLPLVLVAYAPLVGLRWAVQLYQSIGQDILIISHLLVADSSAPYCGYRLWWRAEKPQVDFLEKSFSFPEAVMIVENTVKKGLTLRAVREFIESRRPGIQIEEMVLNRLSVSP